MVEHRKPGAFAQPVRDSRKENPRIGYRQRDLRFNQLCPGAIADITDRLAHGAIGVRGGEDLVARTQFEGAQHGVHAGGRIVDKHHVVRPCPDESGQLCGGFAQLTGQDFPQEQVRICLHALAPALGCLQDGARRRAERPVVEESHAGLEQKLALHSCAELDHSGLHFVANR